MSHPFWLAIGLVLLLEGIGPFVFPDLWRKTVIQLSEQPNLLLRRIGGCLFVAGLVIVYFYSR